MEDPSGVSPAPMVVQLNRRFQHYQDMLTPYKFPRWGILAATLALYLLRTYIIQGWYIVTYALGIYLLNLLIAFLSPKIDPAMGALDDDDDDDDADGMLPTKNTEEFKPFIRRLPEFKCWMQAQRAVLIATFCTFFDMFNVPVFWPILVLYFIVLFSISMKRQIRHMIKYKYLPWSAGKTAYKGKMDSSKVIVT